MKPVMVDGQPLEGVEKKRRFRIYHGRRWHESDDEVPLKALKFQAILYEVILAIMAATSLYLFKMINKLSLPDDARVPYLALILVTLGLSSTLTRRPLIIVPEQKEGGEVKWKTQRS
ncbi:hypothetical protein [Thermococcus sp. 21S7]|uniref:hypothetical protein n=1 Tax=Thermococcus sp. 21S7 TaxID=1638221 RepID=UPI0014396321|nr:hypothetical protein [Thermococcus sp. 21S7]NJE60474.1 hypothetical protein [Thermococcus sp. 21S7]